MFETDNQMPRTRSKSTALKSSFDVTPMLNTTNSIEQVIKQQPIQQSLQIHHNHHQPKRIKSKRLNTLKYSEEKTTRYLQSLKPSYMPRLNKRPKFDKGDIKSIFDNCNPLITEKLLEIQPDLKNQIQELYKFTIFKNIDKVDIKTVKLLQSNLGELSESDQQLSSILSQKNSDEKFYKFYGISYDKDTISSMS